MIMIIPSEWIGSMSIGRIQIHIAFPMVASGPRPLSNKTAG